MRALFTQQLDELLGRLGELAELSGQGLALATKALFDTDLDAAQYALDLDEQLEDLQVDCSNRAVKILALQHPVAADLRLVFSAVRISTDLERMGQLTQHIARVARRRFPDRLVNDALRDELTQMAELSAVIAGRLSDAFTDLDVDSIAKIRVVNAELDDVHSRVLSAVEEPSRGGDVATAIDIALIARFYGRFGDQAVDVADRLIFFVTGRRPASAA
ncbi:phosphate signaling complex protein PhoU [Rhodococcus chondri]|uniref:Phosphate signaling complex protein PhoU n=1 Tax=Rhodococcus chondri TaxID=3065941 RepID=A0ABU7JU75_9NOCA|nr:phosphate signaling complex protein PhoU [Rhodococcus sp. CC-R104]MEE2033474.1 phosphate signaling complex protein PhoU [Rhodococcus sp. CC-R104]